VGLTIQARNAFHGTNGCRKDKDLEALINIVHQMKGEFLSKFDNESSSEKKYVIATLPVKPFKDVYYKMSLNYLDNFYQKLEALLEALETAREEDSEHESSKILIKVFGEKFPIVEDAKKSEKKPIVTTGHNAWIQHN
jgi:uncharacterized protein with NRDE domain